MSISLARRREMIEIRRHGRGGMGAVTASSVLVEAAYLEGKHGQAFPFFGAERRGAPVLAFTRIDERPVRIHSQVYEPDIVVVLDPSLLEYVDVTSGLKPGGRIVINTARPDESRTEKRNVAHVNATQIARELGLVIAGRPLVNMPMIGALVRATNIVSLESALKAIENRFAHRPKIAKANVEAAKRAYEEAKILRKERGEVHESDTRRNRRGRPGRAEEAREGDVLAAGLPGRRRGRQDGIPEDDEADYRLREVRRMRPMHHTLPRGRDRLRDPLQGAPERAQAQATDPDNRLRLLQGMPRMRRGVPGKRHK